MPSCPNCGKPVSPGTAYCANCGSAINSNHGPNIAPAGRPISSAETSALAALGAGPRSWAGALGIVNILMGSFAFFESPQDLGSTGAIFLAAVTFGIGFLAMTAGVVSRSSRSLAKNAIAAGSVVEASGSVVRSSMGSNRVLLPNGELQVPMAGRAGAKQGFTGTYLGPEGSRAEVIFTKPRSAGSSTVVLLSVNGSVLANAVRCRFVGGELR